MIINFEDLTQELSDDERGIIPVLITGFKLHTEKNPIKEPDICQKMNSYLQQKGIDIRLTGARLRKCVNFIRVNYLLPLIATSNGYFVSYEPIVIEKQIKSLEQRAISIQSCAEGLRKFLPNAQG